jgi:opacity protein-like surface antigen
MIVSRARLLGLVVLVVASALPVAAQTHPSVEVSGGYQFINLSVEGEGESLGKGWYADLAANLSPQLGIVFQAGGNYRTIDETQTILGTTASATAKIRVHEYMGGLRYSFRRSPTIVPFGQVLGGAVNGAIELSASASSGGIPIFSLDEEESSTNFGLQLGGGANIRLTDTIGARVGLDYMRIFEEDSAGNVFRFTAGIAFALSR